jgi:hypothetical protein
LEIQPIEKKKEEGAYSKRLLLSCKERRKTSSKYLLVLWLALTLLDLQKMKNSRVETWGNVFFFFGEARKNKEKRPTQSENRLGFPGELIEFNHSLAGYFFSRFYWLDCFHYWSKKKKTRGRWSFFS